MTTGTPRESVDATVASMTLEEKARLLTGMDAWQTVAVPRLGIPSIWLSDGPHGVRRETAPLVSLPATSFPTESALGATWDRDLIRRVASAIGHEAREQGVHVLLGPGINMKRTPLCGRNFEYLSEDPLHAGEMAVAYVEGVQSQGVGTSVKHFAVNNQEDERHWISAVVDERTLRETYLAAFERVVTRARPWTVMCSYNRINGVHASQHHWLLTQVLRDEWGFDGLVVSDWAAVHDRVAALRAGLDLEMPTCVAGPQSLIDAVAAGVMASSDLDASTARVLTLVDRAGVGPAQRDTVDRSVDAAASTPAADAHHALAQEAATRAMVLLRNEGSLLPAAVRDARIVTVVGGFATTPRIQGGGSAEVAPTKVQDALTALREALPEDVEVRFALGFPSGDPVEDVDASTAHTEAVRAAAQADVIVVFAGLPDRIESEGYDRRDLRLPDEQERLILDLAALGRPVVVVVTAGSAIDMAAWHDSVDAILWGWLAGQAGGPATADLLTGRACPSGRLTETFPLRLADTPAFATYPGDRGEVRYGEGTLIGYRWYDHHGMQVRYPFGHGLSYTEFTYGDLEVVERRGDGGDIVDVDVTFSVTNTGRVPGIEVAQVYVEDRHSPVVRGPRSLAAFSSVALAPGESARVTLRIEDRSWRWYDVVTQAWRRSAGMFGIAVGSSSRDIRLHTSVDLPADALGPVLTGEDLAPVVRAGQRLTMPR